jgi:chemotaxis protein methyltransferase CheR
LPLADVELTDRDFQEIARIVHETAGIVLSKTKRDLVYSRLRRRLRALHIASFSEYRDLLRSDAGGDEQTQMINAITTNLTGFFREQHHFEYLQNEFFPMLAAASGGKRRLRIWSAGCSSGEEPYSIAMIMRRAIPMIDEWDAKILATDIDTEMITFAKVGRYTVQQSEAIPVALRQAYFDRVDSEMLQVKDNLKDLIAFRQLNLLQEWPMQRKFDAIFCRNVVIYFDKPTQRILFDRYADHLEDHGRLFIGHSESLFRVSERFQHVGRTIYRKLQ